jgi:hypothetical protein
MAQNDQVSANERVLRRYSEIMSQRDYDSLDEVLHRDYITEWPQSGEVVHGVENLRRLLRGYPGGDPEFREAEVLLGDEERYAMTPTFNLVKIEGSGDRFTAWARAAYPDGTEWFIVSVSTFKDGKVWRQVEFFAPTFDPPDWRSEWVETP